MSSTMGVKNQRILLLGSCGMLGQNFTKSLLINGARLIIADKPDSIVFNWAEKNSIPGIEIDVTDEESVIRGVEKAAKIYGGLDGAVFNAAITGEALMQSGCGFPQFESYPLDLWKKAIDVNLTGAFLFAKEVGAVMKKTGGGSLVNVASIYGVVAPDHRIYDDQAFKSFPAYSASKAGLIGLSKWLASWWAKDGIRVNCLSPGGVFNNHNDAFRNSYSNRTPLARMAIPSDMSGGLLYLLGNSSGYVTGQNLIIDGGLTCW